MEKCRKTGQMKPFLVDNKKLGQEFRDQFLNRLSELVEQGKISPQWPKKSQPSVPQKNNQRRRGTDAHADILDEIIASRRE